MIYTIASHCSMWSNRLFWLKILQKEESLSRLVQNASNEIEKLWQQLTETITEYENDTEDKRKQYEYLREQDDAHRADAAQYPKLHAHLQGTIKSLKQGIHELSRKRQRRITELGDEILHTRKRIESLRQDFSVSQMLDAAQLKKLTIVSSSVLKVKFNKFFIQFN